MTVIKIWLQLTLIVTGAFVWIGFLLLGLEVMERSRAGGIVLLSIWSLATFGTWTIIAALRDKN